MAKAAQWLLCTYLVLKSLQYFFVGRPGFGKVEPGFREKLLRGEPVLFIVACAISVPAAFWSTWYFQRGYERGFVHSADCYGKLGALQDLGGAEHDLDALRVYKSAQYARRAALLSARQIELTPDYAARLMADKLSFYSRQYSSSSRRGDRQEMRAQAAAIGRCMSEPLISF